jgi:hypothetical protein
MPVTHKIKISAGRVTLRAELNDSATARRILRVLPIEASANRWGEEIYFSIPVQAPPENPREVVEVGDLAYWPPGSAFCIFFGRTPASHGDEVRPASPVNVVGTVIGDATSFARVSDGDPVKIEAI